MIRKYKIENWKKEPENELCPYEWGLIVKYKNQTIYQSKATELTRTGDIEISERKPGQGYRVALTCGQKDVNRNLEKLAEAEIDKHKFELENKK